MIDTIIISIRLATKYYHSITNSITIIFNFMTSTNINMINHHILLYQY